MRHGGKQEAKRSDFGCSGKRLAWLSATLLLFALFSYGNTLAPHRIGVILLSTVLYRLGMALFLLTFTMLLGILRGSCVQRREGSGMTFFLYASHYLFLRPWFFMQNGIFRALEKGLPNQAGDPLADGGKLLFYLLSPLYCLFLAYLVSRVVKRLSPKLWKALNGGR